MRTSLNPSPPGRANAAPWRRWLVPGGLSQRFFVALLALPRGGG